MMEIDKMEWVQVVRIRFTEIVRVRVILIVYADGNTNILYEKFGFQKLLEGSSAGTYMQPLGVL
jgi:hypothetical protein